MRRLTAYKDFFIWLRNDAFAQHNARTSRSDADANHAVDTAIGAFGQRSRANFGAKPTPGLAPYQDIGRSRNRRASP